MPTIEQCSGPAVPIQGAGAALRSPSYRRKSCRACGGQDLPVVLPLGRTPLANAFLPSPADFTQEQTYDLAVHFCRNCSLVQLLEVVDPEVLFRNYIYLTGFADTISAHNRAYSATVAAQLKLSASDLVVEVASNDG